MSTIVDKGILQKIQEARTRACDPDTPESEAKAALAESEELIKQHNVLQKDLDADDNETHPDDSQMSIVRIQKIGPPGQRVRQEAFLFPLARAVDFLFHTGSYARHGFYRWDACFDGTAENTMAAAMTFKTAHNQILEWGCAQKGGAPESSYRLGVVHGLEKIACPEKPKKSHRARPKIPLSLETGVPDWAGSDVEEMDFWSEEEYDSDSSDIREGIDAMERWIQWRREQRSTLKEASGVSAESEAGTKTANEDPDEDNALQSMQETVDAYRNRRRAQSPVPEGVKDEAAYRQGVADAAKVKICRPLKGQLRIENFFS